MRIGTPAPKLSNYPPRRSTGDTTSHHKKTISDDPLNPDDFTDVFGGPPRTILSRQFSTNFPSSSSSSSSSTGDEGVFRGPEKAVPAAERGGRKFPQFRVPSAKQMSGGRNQRNDGFYCDVFGWDDEVVVRSRSRSKESSSSVLSSEELSPLRPAVSDGGYDDVSSFAPKLRPINVRPRGNSRKMEHEYCQKQQKLPEFVAYQPFSDSENNFLEKMRNCPFGSSRRNASNENISTLERMSNSSFRMPADDLHFNSPSSAVSSVSDDGEMKTWENVDEILRQDTMEQEEDDESLSSYVIEINPYDRDQTCEMNGIDEAIAWAREKFQTHCSDEKTRQELLSRHQFSEEHAKGIQSVDQQLDQCAADEETDKIHEEMQLMDEEIRLWSTGKEADIRLLLSSLHHILWPNSGWLPIPLTNIIESTQVKKAYQKAQLCLHPDKLQQRGASLPQKYIAEKVFSTLQDSWSAFCR